MDITLYRYQLPLTHPLTFHNQTIQQREGLLLHWGSSWSEIAPPPGFSRETLAEAEQETIAFLTAFKQGKTIPVTYVKPETTDDIIVVFPLWAGAMPPGVKTFVEEV